ncbi:hypothetical protein A6V36_30755 [Paraburkholderia ginsengiterrae]|uniref:Uncharacterized protein n=1 Tax=Paraburkholderia ginsengiterrae TaxID=1462993 RepID=A0A1A9MYM4_9BURK|nr:hypothetical protein A6V37_35505 [Paraburkholderia ginsengiterrae]OAJ57826.1 hypothetical protein A6V36_30755 [Paraburkholderia ginsengiterrae]
MLLIARKVRFFHVPAIPVALPIVAWIDRLITIGAADLDIFFSLPKSQRLYRVMLRQTMHSCPSSQTSGWGKDIPQQSGNGIAFIESRTACVFCKYLHSHV